MSPSYAIPRLFERYSLRYDNIALWEIHEAFCRGSAREKVALSVHLYSVMHNRSDKAPRD